MAGVEAEAVLQEALRADSGLQQALATHLNVSTSQSRMTNVVTVNGTKMRGSQITLGPITVTKPNTTAGLLGLAAALVVVAALLVYGVVQLAGDMVCKALISPGALPPSWTSNSPGVVEGPPSARWLRASRDDRLCRLIRHHPHL
ncbi:hypothetical protein [Streptomyces sp. NPDC058486]|uniref:hypothetical protein n=1 Tax=unclassified Streptomyces TaxID=2593676 RepID=UPI003650B74A